MINECFGKRYKSMIIGISNENKRLASEWEEASRGKCDKLNFLKMND